MAKLAKRYQAAFNEAQHEVRVALAPYLPRCTGQYFTDRDAIETFTVYSKEPDAFEGRHRLRGIVTVWYGMPIRKGESCPVNLSFDAGMFGIASGSFIEMLDKAIPALPPEEGA